MAELNFYFVGLILLLLSSWYSKYIMQNAINLLEDNKKVELINLFQKDNKLSGLTAIGLLVVFIVLLQFAKIPMLYLLLGLFTILIGKILFTYTSKLGKLKANNYPIAYIKKYNLAAIVQISGFVLFFVLTILMIMNYV